MVVFSALHARGMGRIAAKIWPSNICGKALQLVPHVDVLHSNASAGNARLASANSGLDGDTFSFAFHSPVTSAGY
jgi:hypothetical protein